MLKPGRLFNICDFPRGKINTILNAKNKSYLIYSKCIFSFYSTKSDLKKLILMVDFSQWVQAEVFPS